MGTIRALPPQGSTAWYGHYTDLDTEARRVAHSSSGDIVIAADGTGTHRTVEAGCAAIVTGSRVLIKGGSYSPPGPITLPNADSVTIEGWNKENPNILFPAGGDGFRFDGTRRNKSWEIKNLLVRAPGTNLSGGTPTVGLTGTAWDLKWLDRSRLDNLRVTSFAIGIRIDGEVIMPAGGGGSLHNIITNARVTNCGIGIELFGWGNADGGANSSTIWGGEISSCTTGLKSDENVSALSFMGMSFESNTTAIDWAGARNYLRVGRFEGNSTDLILRATAVSNLVEMNYFNPAKTVIEATNPHSNRLVVAGVAKTDIVPAPVIQSMDSRLCKDSTTPPAAGSALYVTITATRTMPISKVSWSPTVTGGKIDCRIYSDNGTQVGQIAAPVATGTVGALQTVALAAPVWLLEGRRYRIALAFDTATTGLLGSVAGSHVNAVRAANAADDAARTRALQFPLTASSGSGLSSSERAVWVRLT